MRILIHLLPISDRKNRQQISKEREDWNHISNQLYLTDIYRKCFSAAKHTIFTRTRGTFSKCRILSHKICINKIDKSKAGWSGSKKRDDVSYQHQE